MYYNITSGKLKINEIKSLLKLKIENHSHKQNAQNEILFNVYKVIEDGAFIWIQEEKTTNKIRSINCNEKINEYIWVRVENKTRLIKNIHCPKKCNEYTFILCFLEINPELKIIDDQNEILLMN